MPEKQAERMEPDGWLSVVWVAFGLAGPGPRQKAPSREGEDGKEGNGDTRSSRARRFRKEARGKCNRRALHIYKGPRSRQGVPGEEAEREWSRTVACLYGLG